MCTSLLNCILYIMTKSIIHSKEIPCQRKSPARDFKEVGQFAVVTNPCRVSPSKHLSQKHAKGNTTPRTVIQKIGTEDTQACKRERRSVGLVDEHLKGAEGRESPYEYRFRRRTNCL